MDIDEVDFPAVSICHPVSWTWPSLLTLFHDIDPNGTVVRQLLAETIVGDDSFVGSTNLVNWQKELLDYESNINDVITWSSLRKSKMLNGENEKALYFEKEFSTNFHMAFFMETHQKSLNETFFCKDSNRFQDLTDEECLKSTFYGKNQRIKYIKFYFFPILP